MKINNVAVIGAGVMGRGIAYAAAVHGFRVRLFDARQAAMEDALGWIRREMDKALARGRLTESVMEAALANIRLCADLKETAGDTDLVIEAVIERMDLKVDIFRKLDDLCPPRAILATNTSTMSPTEIGAATRRPRQTAAMHFFNPAHKMKLVEIIRGMETSDETVAAIREAGKAMGKEAVEVNEFPGFVAGRISCLIGNEAMNMLMEGVACAEDIDKAIRLGLGHPMGPLELADLVGLDTRLRNLEYLHETLGEKYRPCPLLLKHVKAGRLGKKSGRGIYEYDEQGNIRRETT